MKSRSPSVENVHILLVEDNPADQEMARRALEESSEPPQLHVVSDGEEAMDYLLHRGQYADHLTSPTPHLVLLDLNLPKLSGPEVLRQIRTHQTLASLPVIILSTSRADEDIANAYTLGCNAFISKPRRFEDYLHTIQQTGLYWSRYVSLPPRG